MRLLVALVLAAAIAAATAGTASAHPLNTSAVLLDVEPERVGGEVQLPLDPLAATLGRPSAPAAAARYARRHIGATGADGRAWAVDIGGGRVERIHGAAHLVFALSLRPPDGEVIDFTLRYDAIVERLAGHKAFATVRRRSDDGTAAGDPEPLAIFDSGTRAIEVDAVSGAGGGSWRGDVASSARLGVEHIAEGVDHLLFLLMLLIPAPLLVRRGRWVRSDDGRRSARRIVHVVTAFAVGHSITLALAAAGLIDVPARLVESVIALSVLVSAVHAIRPLVPGGEAAIAAGFGLVHGLAFAALIGDLGLSRGALVTSLLGFNLGIELTQLLVVALMMPSLLLFSRTAVYDPFRVLAGLGGVALSAGWLLERTTLTSSDPLAPVSEALVGHPFTVAAAIALLAGIAYCLPFAPVDPRVRRVGERHPAR